MQFIGVIYCLACDIRGTINYKYNLQPTYNNTNVDI